MRITIAPRWTRPAQRRCAEDPVDAARDRERRVGSMPHVPIHLPPYPFISFRAALGGTPRATLPTNRYEAQAGAQLKLGLKWSAWGDMRVQRGDGGYKEVAGQLGLRRSW